jgi:hypothetical protein
MQISNDAVDCEGRSLYGVPLTKEEKEGKGLYEGGATAAETMAKFEQTLRSPDKTDNTKLRSKSQSKITRGRIGLGVSEKGEVHYMKG